MHFRRFLLYHPAFVIALTTLILNDHVLKSAYPGWITGKLSDFAGLVVFVCLLSVIFKRLLTCNARIAFFHVVIGIVFVLWKVLPVEEVLRELSYKTGLPGVTVTQDWTDLIALFSLALTYRLTSANALSATSCNVSAGRDRVFKSLALGAASFAVLATTPPYFMHTCTQQIHVADTISEARFLFVVEQTLIKHGFVIDDRSRYDNGSYYFGFHSKENDWAPMKGDSSWVVPRFYDADLYLYIDPNGGSRIGPLHVRLGRNGWNAPADSLIALNILNPLRQALGATDEL